MSDKPKLRPIDIQPVLHQGQQMWLLNDPLRLTNHQLVVPQALAPLLALCDGTRTLPEIRSSFSQYMGEEVPTAVIDEALTQLDQACFLDNERSRRRIQGLLEDYRALPHRPPALADLSYPGNPEALTELFHQYEIALSGTLAAPIEGPLGSERESSTKVLACLFMATLFRSATDPLKFLSRLASSPKGTVLQATSEDA